MKNSFAYEYPDEPRVSSAIQSDNLSSSTSPPLGHNMNYNPEVKLNRLVPKSAVTVTKDLSRMINNIIIQEPSYYESSNCAPPSHDICFQDKDDSSINYRNSTHSNLPKVNVDERNFMYSPEQYFEPELIPSHYHYPKSYNDISTTVNSIEHRGGGDGSTIDQDEDSWNSSEPLARDRCNTWPLPKPAYLEPNVSLKATVQKGILESKLIPPAFGSLAPFSIKEEVEEDVDETAKLTKSDSYVYNPAVYKYLPHSDRITSIAPGEWADTYDDNFDLKLLNQHQQSGRANLNFSRQGDDDVILPLPELTPDDILLEDQNPHHANLQLLRHSEAEIKYDPMIFLNKNISASNPFARSPITPNYNSSNTDILKFISTTTTSSSSASRKNAWGNYSYADLITKAILTSPDKRLTLSQIYDWMVQYIPYFKDKGDSNSSAGWKNSIRHNLSLHNRFIRLQNEGAGKSSWWMINPDAKPGKTARRRAATLDPKAYDKKKGRVRKRISPNVSLSNIYNNSNSGYYVNSNSIQSLSQIDATANPNTLKYFSYHTPAENGDNNVYTCGSMNEQRETYLYNADRSLNSTLLKPPNQYNNRSILSDSSPLTFSSSRNSLSPLSGKGSRELLYHQSPTNHSSDYTETDYGTCNRSSLNYMATPMDYTHVPEFRNRAISCAATFSDNNFMRKKYHNNNLDSFCEPAINFKQKSSYNSQIAGVFEDSHTMATSFNNLLNADPQHIGKDLSVSSLDQQALPHEPRRPYNYKNGQNELQSDENMDWSKPIHMSLCDNRKNSDKTNALTDYNFEQWSNRDDRPSDINETVHYQCSMASPLSHSRDVEMNYKGDQTQKSLSYHSTDYYYNDDKSIVEAPSKVYLDLSEHRDCGFKPSGLSNPIYYNQGYETGQFSSENFANTYQNLDHDMGSKIDSMTGSNSVSSTRLTLTPHAFGNTSPSQHEYSLLRQTLNKPYNQTSANRIYYGLSSTNDSGRESRDHSLSTKDMTRLVENDHEGDRLWDAKKCCAYPCDEDVSFNSYYLQSQSHDHDLKLYSPCREQVNQKESNCAFSPFSMAPVSNNALVNADFNYNDPTSSFN